MKAALFEWGHFGMMTLHSQVAVFVIVDGLSFSTSVDIATSRGAMVYPFAFDEERGASAAAAQPGAILARPRRSGRACILSPSSLMRISTATKLLLPCQTGHADRSALVLLSMTMFSAAYVPSAPEVKVFWFFFQKRTACFPS